MAFTYLEMEMVLSPIDPWRPLMIAQMGAVGFESFVETDYGFMAYIPEKEFREKDFLAMEVFEVKDLKIEWKTQSIAPQNWNREWEENFKPIRVGERCVVRADFHPSTAVDYELVITPKMSFGTGHHETTQMMISLLLELGCDQKTVLDMGAGTGILAILAEKLGAKSVLAIDNDPWCVENIQENLLLNHSQVIEVALNHLVPTHKAYDLVLANINRNVLLDQMNDYATVLSGGGDLLMSGFYEKDLERIQNHAETLEFRFIRKFEKNQWLAAHFTKK